MKAIAISLLLAAVPLAGVAYVVFLRGTPREAIPQRDCRLASVLALGIIGILGVMVAGFWVLYQTSGEA